MVVAAAAFPSVHLCPLCGELNACALAGPAKSDAPCWCESASFSAALLAAVPVAAQGKACVCERCAALARERNL